MSANVHQREEWSWFCADCCAGGDWSDDDVLIESEATQHDAEYHAEVPS